MEWNIPIRLKNGTKSALELRTEIPLAGELIIESDTGKFKMGDGIKTYINLPYLMTNLPYGDMLKSVYATTTSVGYVDKAKISDKLTTARKIELTGAVTGFANFDGTADIQIPTSITAITTNNVFIIAVEADLTSIVGMVTGDVAVATTDNKSFIYKDSTDGWILLETPTSAVTSVNTKTGIVTLTTQDISENTNLYYTDARVDTEIDDYLPTLSFVINGGNA